jgi:hypothetical protein
VYCNTFEAVANRWMVKSTIAVAAVSGVIEMLKSL